MPRTLGLAVSGSLGDRIGSVAAVIEGLESLASIEWAWPKLVMAMSICADRAILLRGRGSELAPAAEAALNRLEVTIREHPALAEPGGRELAAELLRLIERVRRAR